MAIQISPSDSATAVEEVVGVVMQCQMILIPGGGWKWRWLGIPSS